MPFTMWVGGTRNASAGVYFKGQAGPKTWNRSSGKLWMECSLTINHNQNRALLGRGRGAPSCLPLIQTSLGRKRGRGWACLPWVTLQGTSSG